MSLSLPSFRVFSGPALKTAWKTIQLTWPWTTVTQMVMKWRLLVVTLSNHSVTIYLHPLSLFSFSLSSSASLSLHLRSVSSYLRPLSLSLSLASNSKLLTSTWQLAQRFLFFCVLQQKIRHIRRPTKTYNIRANCYTSLSCCESSRSLW